MAEDQDKTQEPKETNQDVDQDFRETLDDNAGDQLSTDDDVIVEESVIIEEYDTDI